jgi:hypothetical protein
MLGALPAHEGGIGSGDGNLSAENPQMSDKRFFLAVAAGILLAVVVTWLGLTFGLN